MTALEYAQKNPTASPIDCILVGTLGRFPHDRYVPTWAEVVALRDATAQASETACRLSKALLGSNTPILDYCAINRAVVVDHSVVFDNARVQKLMREAGL